MGPFHELQNIHQAAEIAPKSQRNPRHIVTGIGSSGHMRIDDQLIIPGLRSPPGRDATITVRSFGPGFFLGCLPSGNVYQFAMENVPWKVLVSFPIENCDFL